MRRSHFEAFQPLCLLCRRSSTESRLVIGTIELEHGDDVLQGILNCPTCGLEYPIVDGVPIVVNELRKFVSENAHHLTTRSDLAPAVESLIGDCIGPGTHFDATRQHLSNYVWDHWADLDPDEPEDPELRPGAIRRCLDAGLQLLPSAPRGPSLDVGCSVGRTTVELANRTGELALGLDLNLSMLRVATRAVREGRVQYPRRRVGIVYDRREFDVELEHPERVDYWACDAAAIPLADGVANLSIAMNLIDCVPSPVDLLTELERTLAPDGGLVVATPFDWASGATGVEAWVGGHSQRAPGGGSSEPLLRALLTPAAHPQSTKTLQITGEIESFPWHVRLHDRSSVRYRACVVVSRKS